MAAVDLIGASIGLQKLVGALGLGYKNWWERWDSNNGLQKWLERWDSNWLAQTQRCY